LDYVALTVARNEEEYIEQTIKSVLSQTVQPKAYIIIDDGSTDKTPEIIKSYVDKGIIYYRLNGERHELRSYNLCRAVNVGHKLAGRISPDWSYSLKIDADSVIPEDYVENLLAYMKRHPRLGIVSGRMKGRKMFHSRPSDGARLFRRECWDAIGGVDYVIGFDTHAVIKCNQFGFTSLNTPEEYLELRTSKRQTLHGWYLSGITRYYLGLPLWHTFCTAILYLNDKPYILGSIVMFLTHILHMFHRRNNRFDSDYYGFAKGYVLKETLDRIRCYLIPQSL